MVVLTHYSSFVSLHAFFLRYTSHVVLRFPRLKTTVSHMKMNLIDGKQNPDSTRRECLAVVWEISLLRLYLEGTGLRF